MTEAEFKAFLAAPATPCPLTQRLVDGLIEKKEPDLPEKKLKKG